MPSPAIYPADAKIPATSAGADLTSEFVSVEFIAIREWFGPNGRYGTLFFQLGPVTHHVHMGRRVYDSMVNELEFSDVKPGDTIKILKTGGAYPKLDWLIPRRNFPPFPI
jgi:hypothetical protein